MKTSCHNVSPRKSLLSLGATIAALPIFAADQTLTYAAGDTSLGDGVVEFTYDGDKITKIVSNVAKDDTVTLKGAALAFGTGATIETAGLGDRKRPRRQNHRPLIGATISDKGKTIK